jgi:hypothetical protein
MIRWRQRTRLSRRCSAPPPWARSQTPRRAARRKRDRVASGAPRGVRRRSRQAGGHWFDPVPPTYESPAQAGVFVYHGGNTFHGVLAKCSHRSRSPGEDTMLIGPSGPGQEDWMTFTSNSSGSTGHPPIRPRSRPACSSGARVTRSRWARTGRFRWFEFATRTQTNRRYWSLRTRPKERLAPRSAVT